jgi:hypothetical protein
MRQVGRYDLSEISFRRLCFALKTRYLELPHSFAWNWQPDARANRERIRDFRGIHSGQRCFIVANGPSLLKTDLGLLRNDISFGMNRIYLLLEETPFCPTYYLAINELVLEQFSGDIRQLGVPKFLNWNRRFLFEPEKDRAVFLKSRMVIRDFFQRDMARPLVMGATVTFVALQLAYYMGFQKVILVGLDHSYVEKGTPSGMETRTAERDESHFHPNYFPKGAKWQLPDLLRSEIDYRLARAAYERDGREILDATIGGKCNVFEKVDYLSLFE